MVCGSRVSGSTTEIPSRQPAGRRRSAERAASDLYGRHCCAQQGVANDCNACKNAHGGWWTQRIGSKNDRKYMITNWQTHSTCQCECTATCSPQTRSTVVPGQFLGCPMLAAADCLHTACMAGMFWRAQDALDKVNKH